MMTPWDALDGQRHDGPYEFEDLVAASRFGSYKQLRQGKPSPVDTDTARESNLKKNRSGNWR